MVVARALTPLPRERMQTFTVDAPEATHWKPATCEQVGCKPYLTGWTTALNPSTQGAQIAAVRRSGRRPSHILHEQGLVIFVFEAGTPCFQAAAHRVRLDRPELYVVQRGRATARPIGGGRLTSMPTDPGALIRRHTRPEHFAEDMAEQTEAVVRRLDG
jgi:hypothetical protein